MVQMITYLILAQPNPDPASSDLVSWGLSTIKWIVEQFAAKNYAPAVAGIVLVLVQATKLIFKDKLSNEKLPMVSAAIGLVLSVAAALTQLALGAGAPDIFATIAAGLTSGALASGFWSLVGKKLVELFSKLKKPALSAAETEDSKE